MAILKSNSHTRGGVLETIKKRMNKEEKKKKDMKHPISEMQRTTNIYFLSATNW